jgi:hypothetical protein
METEIEHMKLKIECLKIASTANESQNMKRITDDATILYQWALYPHGPHQDIPDKD